MRADLAARLEDALARDFRASSADTRREVARLRRVAAREEAAYGRLAAESCERHGLFDCAAHEWRCAASSYRRAGNPSRAADATERAFSADARQQQPTTPLGLVAPALDRWRQQVLEAGQRRTPLERAAAWEATALECDRRGLADQARHAREHARSILLSTPSRVA